MDWERANRLLQSQTELRKRMQGVFLRHAIATGLYKDEPSSCFPDFVNHVQSYLATSPRTILRRAVDCTFAELYETSPALRDLCALLKIEQNTKASTEMHPFIQVFKSVSPGKCHKKYEWLQKDIKERDAAYFRRKIVYDMQQRRVDHLMNHDDLQRLIALALENDSKRCQRLREKLACIQKDLETDQEYLFYAKVQSLFVSSGLQDIWDSFMTIDTAICHNRSKRGARLEKQGSPDCFAMMALDFIRQNPQFQVSDFSYERNIYWWREGQKAGEVDLALLCLGEIVAICEMKTSCFEIAVAIRQHERKLMALSESPESWTIGRSADHSFPASAAPLLFYFATILPRETEQMMGVEPRLAQAVCEGIRAEGLCISNDSTSKLARPLLSHLRHPGSVDEALDYLQNIVLSKAGNEVRKIENGLEVDYEMLRLFVKRRIQGKELFEKSPAACMERHIQNLFVIEVEESRNGTWSNLNRS